MLQRWGIYSGLSIGYHATVLFTLTLPYIWCLNSITKKMKKEVHVYGLY